MANELEGTRRVQCYDFIAHIFKLTIVFVYELCSRTLCAQWMYHTIPARLLVCFLSVSHVPGPCTCTFPFPFHVFLLLYQFGLSTRPCLHFCIMLTSFVSSSRLPSRYSWTVDSCLHLRLVSLPTDICNCTSQFTIYTIGDGDLFPIFNLLCNHPKGVTCEIPRTLSRPL